MNSTDLKHACIQLSRVLLESLPANEDAMIQRVVNSNAALTLRRVEQPKIEVTCNQPVSGGNSYPMELTIGGMTVGLSIVTNYDRVNDSWNRFVEIVPMYVTRGGRTHWWVFETDPLIVALLTNHLITLRLALLGDGESS